MIRRIYAEAVLLFFCGAAMVCAQVPSHATQLNPSNGFHEPVIARSGNTIHACGTSPHRGTGYSWIHYSRSDDGGRRWPVREMAIGYGALVDDIAVDGDLVVVLVTSQFFGPHTISSSDGGVTWALPVHVGQQIGSNQFYGSELLVRGSTVSVCWFEDRATGQLWFNQSLDGGATWGATDRRLDTTAVLGTPRMYFEYFLLAMYASGNRIDVVWDHSPPVGGDTILRQQSLDGGVTWLPTPAFVTNGTMVEFAGDAGSMMFAATNGPGTSHTVWQSSNAGTAWNPVTNHGLTSRRFLIAVDGLNILVTGLSGTPTASEASVSQDGGATWLPTTGLLPTTRSMFAYPSVTGSDFFMQFRFFDQMQPSGFVLHSDGTSSQWRQLIGEAGIELRAWPDTCIVTTRGPGTGDATFAYVLAGHTTVGAGTPGTGGITPELAGRALPLLGGTFSLEVAGARGGSLGLLGVAFSAPVNIALGSATLHLQAPTLALAFFTSGTVGTAGVGSFSLPVTVPVSASFIGLPVTSQAFVLDPFAVDGFASTRGVETWIG